MDDIPTCRDFIALHPNLLALLPCGIIGVMTSTPALIPQAIALLDSLPLLRAAAHASLDHQVACVQRRLACAYPRPTAFSALTQLIAATKSGLIALEGPLGSGVSTLLCALAIDQPYPIWLMENDAGGGAAALYAQIVAMHRPSLPLIDPAVASDPTAFERLLDEIMAHEGSPSQLVLLLDGPTTPDQPSTPLAPPLPSELPLGVVVVYGCTPGSALPYPACAHLKLPLGLADPYDLVDALLADLHCPLELRPRLATAAGGNFTYLRLSLALIQAQLLEVERLPGNLHGLYEVWWEQLDERARRLALALAAAGEPLPLTLCAELIDEPAEPWLRAWTALGLVQLTDGYAALEHPALRSFFAMHLPAALADIHAALANLATCDGQVALAELGQDARGRYLMRQLARHAALAPAELRYALLPQLTRRAWVRAQDRQGGGLVAAARDCSWALSCAVDARPPLPTVRAAALGGTLLSKARTLNTDGVVAALTAAVERYGREPGLKRVVELVDQLPDGRDKALILRQLGEACYGLRMRSSAMRLLSRALDLEEKPISRSWRDQRDQLLAVLAEAALAQEDIETALVISLQIEHLERRAQAETLAVRWLLGRGDLTRAQRAARAILHESMGAWARAEVGVALCRAADPRGPLLIEEIAVDTVAAWAQIELACDEAQHQEATARTRIAALTAPGQRDRGLARLAQAFARAAKDGDALAAAEQIADVEVRVAALLDLRLTLDGLVAMLALERATSDISALQGDARAPLLAALAAAHAALGRRRRALGIVEQLPVGEERDRALSKVAVAFARQGDFEQAQQIVQALEDDDERDWALDELTRLLSAAGQWAAARALADAIGAADQQAHTLADLATAQARSGRPTQGLELACTIAIVSERTRALMLIAPLLIEAGLIDSAFAVAAHSDLLVTSGARSRYWATLAVALAERHASGEADLLDHMPLRPLDRARALLTIAHGCAVHDSTQAHEALGRALLTAAIGRDEAIRVLEQAAPALGLLGGPMLLRETAAVVDEIDGFL